MPMHMLKQREIDRSQSAGTLNDGEGLYLQVRIDKEGRPLRSWLFKKQIGGKRHQRGLGTYPVVSLDDARQTAAELRNALRNGDSIARKTAAQEENLTFGQFAERQMLIWNGTQDETGETVLKQSGTKYVNAMKKYLPGIWSLHFDQIADRDLVEPLRKIWVNQHPTAKLVQVQASRVFAAAMTEGLIDRDPAKWEGKLSKVFGKSQHRAKSYGAIDYVRLPGFYQVFVTEAPINPASLALRLVLLTGLRISEALKTRWDEVKGAELQIPAERMKMEKDHIVPLSDEALAILAQARNLAAAAKVVSPFVFFSETAVSGHPNRKTVYVLLKKYLGENDAAATIHGMRSALTDYFADQTDYPDELIERVLSHKVGNEVSRRYRRTTQVEKRVEVMQHWADFVTGRRQIGSGSVTRLRF